MRNALVWVAGQLRLFGPYFAIELILPGGSLLALLLWLYRHRAALWHREGALR
jgi:hypothetical protein